MMKRLKYLTLATLVAFAACDEGAETVVEPVTGSVAVSVSAEGENVDGATVTLTGEGTSQSQTTSGGSATFQNVVEGSYVVSLSGIPTDYVFGTTTMTTNVTEAQPDPNVSFTGTIVRTASISGQVTASGTGVEGVEITIDGPEGTEVRSTNPSGNYVVSGLRSGSYTVSITGNPDEDRYTFNTTTASIDLGVGEAGVINFGGVETLPGSITGSVTSSGHPVEGATVTIDGPETASKQTSAAGNYSFQNLTPGTYTVTLTVSDPDIVCDETEQTVELGSDETEVVDFGCELVVEPDVAIEAVIQDGANADRDNIMGTVNVVVNVRPRGSTLTNVDLMVRNTATGSFYLVDRETFVQAAPPAETHDEEDDAVDIEFQWTTDAIRLLDGSHPTITVTDALANDFQAIDADVQRPYHPIFENGVWEVWARVLTEESDPQSAIIDVTLGNNDAINLGVTADNTNWNDPTTGEPFPNTLIETTMGLRWLSGDIHITVYPIIYSQPFDPNDPLLQRGAFMFDGFVGGADVTRGGTELTAPNNTTNNTFRFSFCELGGPTAQDGSACYASIAQLNTGFIGARNVMVQTKTEFGQFGPGTANIKSISLFDTELQSGTGVINDVLRIDNESPVPGVMDETNLPHPANALANQTTGVANFSRTGIGNPGLNLGWVNWTDIISGTFDPSNSDTPSAFPDLDKTGTDVAQFCDPAGNCVTADGTVPIGGIGIPAGNPNLIYIAGPDFSGTTVTSVISNATLTETGVIRGDQLPPETDSPGLTDQCPDGPVCSEEGTPFSDTELDYGMTSQDWDLFGNVSNATNYLLLGVDGKSPIFSDAAGLTAEPPTDPAVDTDGTKYNTFDDDHYELDLAAALTYGRAVWTVGGKMAGQLMGWTTDRDNGFSGVAGIVLEDWESHCLAGELACASTTTTRWGQKLQPVAPGGATTVLPFTFDGGAMGAGGNDISGPDGTVGTVDDLVAWVATQDLPQPLDGYHDERVHTYDRAGNVMTTDDIPLNFIENIADHDGPNVGNVQMPTVVTFDFTSTYTFGGEAADQVDLKMSDFSFDFNSIHSLQVYSDPAAETPAGPGADVNGEAYGQNSLQLPLMNQMHTAFGSASIILSTALEAQTTFLGCLVRFDETGRSSVASVGAADGDTQDALLVEPAVHRPRGPRWRTWDHSSAYGLVNTQFNTFVPSSVPTCAAGTDVGNSLIPAVGSVGADPDGPDDVLGTSDDEFGWVFITDSDNRPVLILKGQTATFVPNVDFDNVHLYYLDSAGRARLLATSASDWTLTVSDTGTGAFGRAYEYTYTAGLPADLNDSTAPANGTTDNYFFVVQLTGSQAGHGLIWDTTSN